MIRLVIRTASRQNTVLFGLLFLIMTMLVMPSAIGSIKQFSGGTGLLDARLCFSPEEAFRMMEAYGPRGRALYIAVELTAGLVYATVGGLFLCTFLVWSSLAVRKCRRSCLRLMILLPVAGMLCNWLENVGVVWMLSLFPERRPLLALATSGLTIGKWALAAVCLCMAAWNLLQWLKIRLVRMREAGH